MARWSQIVRLKNSRAAWKPQKEEAAEVAVVAEVEAEVEAEAEAEGAEAVTAAEVGGTQLIVISKCRVTKLEI